MIDDFEFVWMLSGQAHVTTANRTLRLDPGQLLLIPPGVRHGFRWDQQQACRHGYVHFDPGEIGLSPDGRAQVRRMTRHDPLTGLCDYLLWLGRRQLGGWEETARETLRYLVGLFASAPLPDEDVAEALSPLLAGVVAHLQREWSQLPLYPIRASDLAAAVSVSRSYLNRIFQSEFGTSVAAGLESLRFSRAETLLSRTDIPIGTVARQCGFADPYHFSHRFKKQYGIPPSRFRTNTGSSASVLDDPGVRRLAYALWGD